MQTTFIASPLKVKRSVNSKTIKVWHKSIFCFLLFALSFSLCYAKPGKLDSLQTVLKSAKSDTDKVKALVDISKELEDENKFDSAIIYGNNAEVLAEKLAGYSIEAIARAGEHGMQRALAFIGIAYNSKGNYTKAVEYLLRSIKILEKENDKTLLATNLNGIGNVYIDLGDYTTAMDDYRKSLKIAEEIKDTEIESNALGNIGLIYGYYGDYSSALDYYLRGLKIAEKIGNKPSIAADLSNIGTVYFAQKDTVKTIEYFNKSIEIYEQLGDKSGIATNLDNIGALYGNHQHYVQAIASLQKALKLAEELNDKQLQANILGNLGSIYADQHNLTNALDCYQRALSLARASGDRNDEANNIGNIGDVYAQTGKFKEAEEYLKRAAKMVDSLGDKYALSNFETSLSELYDTTGRYQLSLLYYKRATALKDSLFNLEKNKSLTQKEMTYEFKQKEELEKAEQDKKDAIAAQDKKKEVIIRDFFIGGFLLLLVLAFFIYRSYREKKKDNIIITHQKELVEEKQKEILDSIHYAQRIQKALLASDTLLKQYLNEYFVLYKPKDIVSGDFYWATVKDNRFYLGVCDSTGHGVPGAFMSLLNISFLNEAITEKGIKQPHEVFNHTRKRLIENISQDGQQDGMDGALLCFDKSGLKLEYAAAYNTPIVIRNGQLIELTGDKIPVGSSPKQSESFTNYSVDLQKGDVLYAFTDGYADQFGGPKGKKFKSKHLQEQLIAVSGLPIAEQKVKLNQVLEDWKKELEQVDDILVIGIKV